MRRLASRIGMVALFAVLVSAGRLTPASAENDHSPPRYGRSAGPLGSDAIAASDSTRFLSVVADANLLGVTITNYGFIGNNFISRSPSLEYPLGAGYEHLVRGGLWVGAMAQDTAGFVGVTSAAQDGYQSANAQSATEYTPAGKIQMRSTLPNEQFFSPNAVSELDLLSDYSDRPAKSVLDQGERHRPLGIIVHQENYSWSFSDYQHLNIFHYRIKNDGPPMQNVWVGIYGEFASGNKNAQSTWAPPGSWYNKKWVDYDGDTLRLLREHYCAGAPYPDNCQLNVAPYWIGLKLLGWKNSRSDTVMNKQVTLAAWNWRPGDITRNEDVEKYGILSAGTVQSLHGALDPPSGDPVELLAVGPFSQVDPQDTIVVDFALVGGKEVDDLRTHAQFAQRAFDRDYIVPVPPPSPRLKVIARHNTLDLYWDRSPEDFVDITNPIGKDFEGYRIYVGEDRLDLHRIAEFDKATPPNDTLGYNTGFGAVAHDTTIDGQRYHYRYSIDHLRDGFKYFVAVTAYDLGSSEIESLESGVAQNKTLAIPGAGPQDAVKGNDITVFPNPYRVDARWDAGTKVRDHYLWFANLPEHAKIKIYTLAGDLVFETDFEGSSYHGQDTRGVYDPKRELDVDPPTLSGRMFAWNMITREGQALATGLYIYTVEDKVGGERKRGKFLVVKSDREDF